MADRVTNIPAGRYRWAIERAGLNVDGYMESHPNIALSEWMSGEKSPTFKQLEVFAKSVNVPIGFLFLDDIPEENVPFPVFRGNAGRSERFDLNVYDTVNIIARRQDWLEEYLVENEIETCKFVGIVSLETPISESVGVLREMLHLEPRWAFSLASAEAAVSKMTDMLSDAGVFVAYNGVVGNNTRRPLKVSECRGFALVSRIAPYIFINSGDAPTAQLFSLAHEAAHILLGVSAGHAATDNDSVCGEDEERYCDKVAAELLVPASELRNVWNGKLKDIARKFRVSELVIARRGHDLRLLSDEEYRDFWNEYSSRLSRNSDKTSKGGDFYKTSVRRVGRMFAIHVKNAVSSSQLSYSEAYRLTGLYGRTYSKFMNEKV